MHNEYPQGKCYATYTLPHMSLTLSWDAGADPPSQLSDSSTGFTNTPAAEDHNTCPLPQEWVILEFEGDPENPMPSQIEKEDMLGRRYLYWSPPEWRKYRQNDQSEEMTRPFTKKEARRSVSIVAQMTEGFGPEVEECEQVPRITLVKPETFTGRRDQTERFITDTDDYFINAQVPHHRQLGIAKTFLSTPLRNWFDLRVKHGQGFAD
uniref:Uncharacterized protein n=1 Tax=Chromera velia CCMP2878 TaxID=1169474 RepID=A0A0G4IB39_9ALVE|eukprot:Cvel_12743.t1-p1 / transcript=Cvel_12743.t1 / gene=Cvel_12743 / organism=Chromera_velia_CCMP2878 / gene_product=hypothetical protein / transcript_product=hypothetical protein / location=Cvel_scaffold847:3615-6591(-) / protein_length=207 / sequence_SO=supercontig / SO=protein_coding / is_pseudo=false